MDIIVAATKTKDFLKERKSAREAFALAHLPCTYIHTLSTLTKIQLGAVTGQQALRYLDWAQSNIIGANVGTLEDMKQINKGERKC